MTIGLIFGTLHLFHLRKLMHILLEEDRYTQLILGSGKAIVKIKERFSFGYL